MKNTQKLLLLITLSFPMVSSADCEKWIDYLLEKYHSSRASNMTVCKICLLMKVKQLWFYRFLVDHRSLFYMILMYYLLIRKVVN